MTTSQKSKRKNFRKADFILAGIILAVALACFGIYHFMHQASSDMVVVEVADSEYARLPLDENAKLVIRSKDGGRNTLIIRDGQAWVSEANCKNQICVHTAKKSHAGDVIVCLPHKVVVSIEGAKAGDL